MRAVFTRVFSERPPSRPEEDFESVTEDPSEAPNGSFIAPANASPAKFWWKKSVAYKRSALLSLALRDVKGWLAVEDNSQVRNRVAHHELLDLNPVLVNVLM